jgi:hypothetical protein
MKKTRPSAGGGLELDRRVEEAGARVAEGAETRMRRLVRDDRVRDGAHRSQVIVSRIGRPKMSSETTTGRGRRRCRATHRRHLFY